MKAKLTLLLLGVSAALMPLLSHAAPEPPKLEDPNVITIIGPKIFSYGNNPNFPFTFNHSFQVIKITGQEKDSGPFPGDNGGPGDIEAYAEAYVRDPRYKSLFTGNLDPNELFKLVEIPFDAGLSVLLGAGAVAAVRRARTRKKEQIVA